MCLRRVCFYPVPLETLQCFAGLRGEQVSIISVSTRSLRFHDIPSFSLSLSLFFSPFPDSRFLDHDQSNSFFDRSSSSILKIINLRYPRFVIRGTRVERSFLLDRVKEKESIIIDLRLGTVSCGTILSSKMERNSSYSSILVW